MSQFSAATAPERCPSPFARAPSAYARIRGPPSTHRLSQRALPRLRTRQPAHAHLPRPPRLPVVPSDLPGGGAALRLDRDRPLPDAQPLPPRLPRPTGEHLGRHAPPEQPLRAVLQPAARCRRPRAARAVQVLRDRERGLLPRRRTVRPPEPSPGRPVRAAGALVLEQLQRHDRPDAATAMA